MLYLPETKSNSKYSGTGISLALSLPVAFILVQFNGINVFSMNTPSMLVFFNICVSVFLWIYLIFHRGSFPFLVMHCFVSIWLILLPALHHLEFGYFPLFLMRFEEGDLIRGGIIALTHGLFFALFYILSASSGVASNKNTSEYSLPIIHRAAYLLFASALLFVFVHGIGTYTLQRAEVTAADLESFQTVTVYTIPRAFPIALIVISAFLLRHRKVWPFVLALGVGAILLAPQNAPRVQILSVALAVLFVLFDFRKPLIKISFPLIAFFGLTVLLPLLNQVSRNDSSSISIGRIYEHGDFAQFQGTAVAVQYISDVGLQWGRQIAGALLFFVPRQLWPGKPESTAELASRGVGMAYNNISIPLHAEFYVDFGLIGVVVFSSLLGLLARRFDTYAAQNAVWSSYAVVPVALMFGMTGMLVRGALMPVLPIILFPLALTLLISWISSRRSDD